MPEDGPRRPAGPPQPAPPGPQSPAAQRLAGHRGCARPQQRLPHGRVTPARSPGHASSHQSLHVRTWPGTSPGTRHGGGPFPTPPLTHCVTRGEPCPSPSLRVWRTSSYVRFQVALYPVGSAAKGPVSKMFSQALMSVEECQDVTCLHTNCHVPSPAPHRPSPCFLAPLPGLCSIAYSNLNLLIFLPTFTVLRL